MLLNILPCGKARNDLNSEIMDQSKMMRVVYIHAGANKGTTKLKNDDYHKDLFKRKLNLRFKYVLDRNIVDISLCIIDYIFIFI